MSQDMVAETQRDREDDLMDLLARCVMGEDILSQLPTPAEIRQAGYGAMVARGRIDDPEDRLLAFLKACHASIGGWREDIPEGIDPFQARWGADWYVDPMKLKNELPSHLERLRRRAAPRPSLS